jgi:hypothetical protein
LSKNISLNTLCGCGKKVRSCKLWTVILKELDKELGVNVLVDPYSLHLGYPLASFVVDKSHQTNSYKIRRKIILGLCYLKLRFGINFIKPLTKRFDESTDNNFILYDKVRKHLNADIVVDSSKGYLKGLSLYIRNPKKVKLILLTRDGRGVLYSNLKRKYPLRKSVQNWKKYYTRFLRLANKYVNSNHILHVRYEELTENPEKELKNICIFLNMEFEKQMLDYASHIHHITNGNDMRFIRSSNITPDIGWKNSLSVSDRKYFERKAGKLNVQLGYR